MLVSDYIKNKDNNDEEKEEEKGIDIKKIGVEDKGGSYIGTPPFAMLNILKFIK